MPSDMIDRLNGVRSSKAIKVPCRVATTANITLSGEQTIDGVSVVEGNRVLVKNQTTASQNGIYKASTGIWRRERDFDGPGDITTGTRVFVYSGTLGYGDYIVTTTGDITFDTTSITIELDVPTVHARLQVGASSAANTAALVAAVARAVALGGARVVLPPGIFTINEKIVLEDDNIHIVGDGMNATQIYQDTLDEIIFEVQGHHCSVQDLTLSYFGTVSSGATAIHDTGWQLLVQNVQVNNAHKAIFVNVGNGKLDFVHLYNSVSSSIHLKGAGSIWVDHFVIDNGTDGTKGVDGNIIFEDFVEGCFFSNGSILGGLWGFRSGAATYAAGSRPAYNIFNAVYFDGSIGGAVIDEMVETDFIGCWFSNGRSGAGSPGCSVAISAATRFTSCRFINCGSHGAFVGVTASNVSFAHCVADGNSVTTGAGVSNGFHVEAGVNTVRFYHCIAGNRTFIVGTQGYGIALASGATDGIIIIGCDLRLNATGGLLDDATGTNKLINNNLGTTIVHHGAKVGIAENGVLDFGGAISWTHNASDGSLALAGGTFYTADNDFYNTIGKWHAKSAVATAAGGVVGFQMGLDGIAICWGSGAPTLSAPKSSIYFRTDGSGTDDRAYINTDGSTTWANLVAAA